MGVRISVSPAFVLLWTAVYFFDTGNLLIPVAVSVAVHELCHLLALYLTGCQVKAVNFCASGMEIVCQDMLSYPKEFLCSAAGPFGSAVFAVCAACCKDYISAGINISLFLFNTLPVLPLDGGKMLYSFAAWFFNDEKAEKLVFISTLVVMLMTTIMAMWLKRWEFAYFALMTCKFGKNGVKFHTKRT